MKCLLLAGLALAGNCWAMSKPFDAYAAAVIKKGKPCFYLPTPVDAETPDYLRGEGVYMGVFDDVAKKSKWESWLKTRPKINPTSPNTCIPYGFKSPDKNRTLAEPLTHDTAYIFDMYGEYGRNRLYFCIKKDAQGKDYLSKSGPQGHCSSDPL